MPAKSESDGWRKIEVPLGRKEIEFLKHDPIFMPSIEDINTCLSTYLSILVEHIPKGSIGFNKTTTKEESLMTW